MVVFFEGALVAFPGATQKGLDRLVGLMAHAVIKHNEEGRPPSGGAA